MRLAIAPALVAVMSAAVLGGQSQLTAEASSALRAYWSAETPEKRAAASSNVLTTGIGYDELATRLKAGREYRSARTGRVNLRATIRGVALDNVIDIPPDYSP